MAIAQAIVIELRAALSPAALVTAEQELPAYGRDWWAQRGTPGAVVRAATVDDVTATLRFAAAHGVPVVPRAAGTNIGGGFLPSPERILLDLRALDRVLSIDAERREAVVEPGVLNGALQGRLAPRGLLFAPDPASALLSTIGGNIAENAGGPHCLKYGVTVHHVAAVTCALPGGDLVRLAAEDAGPDLLGVMVGSEGTLGVVTQATVRLRSRPAVTRTLLAVFDRAEDAAEAVSATIAAGVVPAALEYFDGQTAALLEGLVPSGYPIDAEALLLIDVDGERDEVARDLAAVETHVRARAREVRRADDDEARALLWRGRLHGAQALVMSGRGYYICDTTVPRERIPAMQQAVAAIAQRHGLRIPTMGHAGDGNIHPVILFDKDNPVEVAAMRAAADEVVVAALALGGTLTGEHGVGSEKREQMRLRFTPVEIAAMRAVKDAFDPSGILNPGVLLPGAAPDEPSLPRFAAAVEAAVASRRAGHAWPGWHDAAWPRAAEAPREATEDDEAAVDVDPENLTATVGAGAPASTLHERLAARGYSCALPHTVSTIGAIVGGGEYRQIVRDALLAVRAMLPDGAAACFGSRAVKDVAGYDLKRLYIGSGAACGRMREVIVRVTAERRG